MAGGKVIEFEKSTSLPSDIIKTMMGMKTVWIPLALVCALFMMVMSASAKEICVGEPGICERDGPAWIIMQYEPLTVTTADTLVFSFTPNHNVNLMPDAAAYDACNFRAEGNLLDASIPGSNFTVRADGVRVLTIGDLDMGTYYFACSVGSHCRSGQRIVIDVIPGGLLVPAPEPEAE